MQDEDSKVPECHGRIRIIRALNQGPNKQILDLKTEKGYSDWYRNHLDDCGTLYIGGLHPIPGCDDMSLLCVIVREDFIIVASDTKYTLPGREHGGDVFGSKIFRIDDTNLVIGSTGSITYGQRHFHNIVLEEINQLEDKSFSKLHDFIWDAFPAYIKENGSTNCEHFAFVYLFGWESGSFRGDIFQFKADGQLAVIYGMGCPDERFSGASEGYKLLENKLNLAKKNNILTTEEECIAFIEESFTEIIKVYKAKPKIEQTIGGDIEFDVLYRKES